MSAAATAAPSPPYGEPLRTAIAVAFCGTFVATVALLTATGVLGSLFDSGERRPDQGS
jgi:hypothetical protein